MRLLVFLTVLSLMLTATHVESIRQLLEYGRWVPFFLFSLLVLLEAAVKRNLMRRVHGFDAFIISWITLAFCTAFYSISPELTVLRSGTLLLMYVAVFWGIWSYVNRRGEEQIIDIILMAALFIYGASWTLLPVMSEMRQADGRFRGVMENPNALGILTALLLPLALWRSLQRRMIRDHLLLFVMVLSLVLTGNRSGMIAAFIAAMYIFWKARSRMLWAVMAATILIVVSFFIEPYIPEGWYENAYIRPNTLSTGSGRIEVLPVALTIISERPLEGHGFGTEELLLEYYGYSHADFLEHQGAYFHNAFLGLAAQTGLIGSISFFLPLIIFAIQQARVSRNDHKLEMLHALQGVMLAGLILCFSESWIYSMGNAFAFPFWISVMLLLRRASFKYIPSRVAAHMSLPYVSARERIFARTR